METLIVDDSDPAVKYSSGWQKAGGGNEHDNTTSGTNQTSRTATFTFVGSRIEVYGTIGPRIGVLVSPQSNYSIDGISPTTYTANQDQDVYYHVMFYQSPSLPLGPHTLVITNLLNSTPFYLDYFYVFKPAANPSSSNVVTVTSIRTVSASSSSSTSQISPSTTPSDLPSPSSSNTAAIVGSIFGAIFLIIVAVAFVWWHRGRKERKIDDLIYPTSTYKEPSPTVAQTRVPDDALRYQEPATEYGHARFPDDRHRNAQPAFDATQSNVLAQQPAPASGHTTAHHVNGRGFAVEPPSMIAYRSNPYDGYVDSY